MSLAKQVEKLAADNSPLILTAIGVTGTITTAVLTGKATIKAVRLIDSEYQNNRNDADYVLEPKEKARLAWKLYIPPVAVGTLTVVSIIGANRIGTRRAAAMAAAYAVSQEAFNEYRDKVVEKIGDLKERNIRDDLAQDRVNKNPVENNTIVITNGGNVLCYEQYTGRYFQSDMETLKKAQNDLNYQVNNSYYASLSDFYDLIGLERTTESDEVGWNSNELLELHFSTTLAGDGRPCLAFEYRVVPIRGYARVH